MKAPPRYVGSIIMIITYITYNNSEKEHNDMLCSSSNIFYFNQNIHSHSLKLTNNYYFTNFTKIRKIEKNQFDKIQPKLIK